MCLIKWLIARGIVWYKCYVLLFSTGEARPTFREGGAVSLCVNENLMITSKSTQTKYVSVSISKCFHSNFVSFFIWWNIMFLGCELSHFQVFMTIDSIFFLNNVYDDRIFIDIQYIWIWFSLRTMNNLWYKHCWKIEYVSLIEVTKTCFLSTLKT